MRRFERFLGCEIRNTIYESRFFDFHSRIFFRNCGRYVGPAVAKKPLSKLQIYKHGSDNKSINSKILFSTTINTLYRKKLVLL